MKVGSSPERAFAWSKLKVTAALPFDFLLGIGGSVGVKSLPAFFSI